MPTPMSIRCSRASNTRSSSDSLEQPRPDFLPPPTCQCVRIALPHGQRLDLAARCEYLGADAEFRGASIDDFDQVLDHRLLFGRWARVLAGGLVVQVGYILKRARETGRQTVVERRRGTLCNGENRGIGEYPGARQIALARELLAPHGDGFGAGPSRRRQLRETAQPHPCQGGIGLVQPLVLERQAILRDPVFTLQVA